MPQMIDFGIFVRKQPPITAPEPRLKWVNEKKNDKNFRWSRQLVQGRINMI